jgi:hypothetical protein
MSELTPEELDEARAVEAFRSIPNVISYVEVGREAARLTRIGWTPTPKVDPDLLAAREWGATTEWGYAPHYAEGVYDEEPEIIGFLAGIKHGTASATATNSLSDMMALQMKTAAENARLREVLIWVREFAAMRGTDPESVFKKVARDALKTIAVKARNALTGDLTNG